MDILACRENIPQGGFRNFVFRMSVLVKRVAGGKLRIALGLDASRHCRAKARILRPFGHFNVRLIWSKVKHRRE